MLHIHKPHDAAAVGKQQTAAAYMWRRPTCFHGGCEGVAIRSWSEATLHILGIQKHESYRASKNTLNS